MGLSLTFTTATFAYMPHSAVVSCFESAILRSKGRMMAGDVSDPPPKQGGHAAFRSGRVLPTSTRPHDGSLTSSFIPAGRLVKTPLSPRASSCRIGPRRQGFASPLRALDGSGPIRKTRCLRGERGGARSGELRGALVHDKGYYHSYLGRSRKEPFGHTSYLSRSRGALSPAGP